MATVNKGYVPIPGSSTLPTTWLSRLEPPSSIILSRACSSGRARIFIAVQLGMRRPWLPSIAGHQIGIQPNSMPCRLSGSDTSKSQTFVSFKTTSTPESPGCSEIGSFDFLLCQPAWLLGCQSSSRCSDPGTRSGWEPAEHVKGCPNPLKAIPVCAAPVALPERICLANLNPKND
jgi:hypothetical protein